MAGSLPLPSWPTAVALQPPAAVVPPTGSAGGEEEAVSDNPPALLEELRFPFPPEPPGLGLLEPQESAELESVAPWDLLKEVTEVDVDSLPGASYEPPFPSHVFSDEHWNYSEFDDERAWYSPVEDETSLAQKPVLTPTGEGESGCPVKSDALTAGGLEVQIQQQAALDLVKRRCTSLVLPWERPVSAVHEAFKHRLQAVPQVGLRESLQLLREQPPLPNDASGVPWTVASRLRRIRIPVSDDELRACALKRLKVLVLLDPEGTQLGLSLLQKTMALKDDDEIRQSLSDAFKGKASSTLQKRGLSLQAFVTKHFELHEGSPWRVNEDQLYAVLCTLRSWGAKPSTANHMLEALRFFDGVCKFLFVNLDMIISSRSRGVARELYLQKEPLRQRDPLSLVQVQGLESLMMGSMPD